MSSILKQTTADADIRKCLDEKRSFYVIAGAGSGKTMSLITALGHIRDTAGKRLRRDVQRIVCVTYTKRAVEVISSRLGWDDLFVVSTLHGFLWGEIKRFTPDIRRTLHDKVLPSHIAKKQEDDDGGKSKKALKARAKALELTQHLAELENISMFNYGDSNFSNYTTGELGHDDVIDIAAHMLSSSKQLQRILGQKYPYIFVDEAQDTQENIVAALNILCEIQGLPMVGYFGDPMQQIYDKRAGDFQGPAHSLRIPKEENFRCSRKVIDLLNAFRKDITQFPAGENMGTQGSVLLRLIQTEIPEGHRKRYTPEQTDRASKKLDEALIAWGWATKTDVKHLYLVRQMIARRLNFYNLHQIFTGEHSSGRSQDEYENGEHFLIKPFIACLYPLIQAVRAKNQRAIIDVLRQSSPAFDPQGVNSKLSLAAMITRANEFIAALNQQWNSASVGDILRYCRDNELCPISKRLSENLDRGPRCEEYDEEKHENEKGEWLADAYFRMPLSEIENYCKFTIENTEFSTQHGVKGEQYPSVLVVFDDIGSAWNNYNFSKMLTPATAGDPTQRQQELSKRLAYVCFSRAEKDLRIVMYSSNAKAARAELLEKEIFTEEQIEVSLLVQS
jgi:DNA helicase II / ATP-dependent DNA helicase PcrA